MNNVKYMNTSLSSSVRLLTSMIVLLLIAVGCSPKVSEPVEEPEEKEPVVEIDPNDPCLTWNALPNKDAIIEAHVLYRDFLKQENYEEAYSFWQKAYEAAPMADGRRLTHFEDGIKLNHHFYLQSGEERYKESIFNEILPRMRQCAESSGYAAGRQAFDLYYSYPDLATDKEIYELFKLAIDEQKEKTAAFVLNPFIKVLTDLYFDEAISMEEAQNYVALIDSAMTYGLSNCGDKCADWEIVESYVPGQMDRLESVEDFFDCDYYMEKYYPEFLESRDDCDVVDNAFIRMKWGGCSEDDPRFKEVAAVKAEKCKQAPAGDPDLVEGRECLESGEYNCAMDAYQRYVDKIDDPEKKAKFVLRMAKISFAHLKNFPRARRLALEAASLRDGWGEPYMLIGNLYASSGPLCGPGTGWASQVVTWPAIDKWNYAKRIDPGVSSEANRLIGRYSRFMPSVGDIFQRGLKEGQRFRVECWIQENTTIRSAPK